MWGLRQRFTSQYELKGCKILGHRITTQIQYAVLMIYTEKTRYFED